jgi:proteasome accessory factor B
MSKRRTERLLSIVVLLLSTRRYLTAEQIRAAVHGYPDQEDAFKRMFERDKEELRDLGIPLETGLNNALDEEPGYRIRRQDYELPEIHLEADEAAVLGIAARVWQSAELAGAAAGALLKLRAAGAVGAAGAPGLDDDQQPRPGIEPRLTTAEPAFGPLWEAVRDRRPVTFSHKAPGRSDAIRRELEPWGVVNRRGHWYVAGHDRTRNATRVFRLDRIEGPVKMSGPARSVTVPPGADVRELVKDWDTPLPRNHEAVLRVRVGAGTGVRRYAKTVTADGDGWDRVTVQFADVQWYADYLAWFGADVMVVGPPDLREAVISRLKGVLA